MKKACRVYVFCTVQGVFFRAFIKENAEKLGVKGYVRNKEDGSVEAWVEGNSSEVDKMIEVCKTGPKNAIIKRWDLIEEKLQDMTDFKILSF